LQSSKQITKEFTHELRNTNGHCRHLRIGHWELEIGDSAGVRIWSDTFFTNSFTFGLYSIICGAIKCASSAAIDSHFSITTTTSSRAGPCTGSPLTVSTAGKYSMHPASARTFGTIL